MRFYKVNKKLSYFYRTKPCKKARPFTFLKAIKKGQVTLEMVLLITLGVGLFAIVKKQFFEEATPVAKFITTPWKSISGMMESGVWKTKDEARKKHPNHFDRMVTGEGD